MKLQLPTKKRLHLWLAVLICGLLAEAGLAWFNHSALGRVWIDADSCGLEFYRGGYQEWRIMWSLGYAQENDGTIQHFWCWPTFTYTDLRKEFGTNVPAFLRYD